MEDLSLLADLGRDALVHGAVILARIGAALALLPVVGEASVPIRVRAAIAFALTLFVAPAVAPIEMTVTLPAIEILLFTETLIGLAFGFAFRILIVALQIAGSMIAQSTSLAQLFGNAAAEPLPAVGHLLVISGLALAAMSGLHVAIVANLIETFDLFPPGVLLDAEPLAEFGVERAARAFSLAFSLAAPFVLAAFVYNLALGAINRAMPQLMVVLVGAPAITGAGLALLAIASPVLLQVWRRSLEAVAADPWGAF